MPKKVEISNVFQPHLSKEKPKITNIFPLHSNKRDFWGDTLSSLTPLKALQICRYGSKFLCQSTIFQ